MSSAQPPVTLIDYKCKGISFETEENIMSMSKKNGDGWFIKESQKEVSLKLHFPVQYKVRSVEVMVLCAREIILQLIDASGDLIAKKQVNFTGKKVLSSVINFQEEREAFLLKVTITCEAGQLIGIKHLLVRGVRSEKSNKKSINNISSEDSFKNGQYVPQSKPSAKQDYEPIIKKTNKDLFDKRIKGKNSENSDLRKAIQQSKKDYQQFQKQQKKHSEQFNQSHYYDVDIQDMPRKYNLVDWSKVKNVYEYVSTGWVEAQRRAEEARGIRQSERLSNLIQVKHLYGKTICVDPSFGPRRNQLEQQCSIMGAEIVHDPVDYCLLITNKSQSDKAKKARKLKNVKILTQNFILDCKKYNATLNEKDYYMR